MELDLDYMIIDVLKFNGCTVELAPEDLDSNDDEDDEGDVMCQQTAMVDDTLIILSYKNIHHLDTKSYETKCFWK